MPSITLHADGLVVGGWLGSYVDGKISVCISHKEPDKTHPGSRGFG